MPTEKRLWDNDPLGEAILASFPLITRNSIGDDVLVEAGTFRDWVIDSINAPDLSNFDSGVNALISAATIARSQVSGIQTTDNVLFNSITSSSYLKIADFSGSASAGMLRYNSSRIQFHNGTAWGNISELLQITGTTNQVNVSNSGGNVTLSLPQAIAAVSTPTFGGLKLEGESGLKLSFIDGSTYRHSYISWYQSNGVTRKGYFGYPSPDASFIELNNQIGSFIFLTPSGSSFDFFVNGASKLNINENYSTFSKKIVASNGIDLGSYSASPVEGSIRYNSGLQWYNGAAWKTAATGNDFPDWLVPFTLNTGRDLYLKIANTNNDLCYQGFILETGVYNQYTTPTSFTTAPWVFGLNQKSVADNDGCGIGQYGLGLYLTAYRRNQIAVGLNEAYEPRGVVGEDNRDDLRFLVKTNQMIKGYEPELFFNNTNRTGSYLQNCSLKFKDAGLTIRGFDANWDGPFDLISFLASPTGPYITANATIEAVDGITLGTGVTSPAAGSLKFSGTFQVYDGASWRVVQVV